LKQIEKGAKLRDIGKGGRYLGGGVGYIRQGDARIFYEKFFDEVKIVGVASKNDAKSLNQVARLVSELYPFIDIDFKNL